MYISVCGNYVVYNLIRKVNCLNENQNNLGNSVKDFNGLIGKYTYNDLIRNTSKSMLFIVHQPIHKCFNYSALTQNYIHSFSALGISQSQII